MSDIDPDSLRTGGALDVYAENVSALEQDDRLVGQRLGDYSVQALIGTGGMARVYRASRVDGAFERDVAIKVSHISGSSQELRERFSREQAILADLEHPNIARLFDAGLTEEGWPYIVMELINGRPIDAYCRDNKLDQEGIVKLGIEVADALAFAHTRLVAHCDLKPSNVLVTDEGRAVLLDFGIAKLLSADSEETSARRPLSPGYASPEQLLSKDITTASDTYQLGALLFQLLVGEPVVDDGALRESIGRASRGEPLADLDRRLKALPRDLARIVAMSLRQEPQRRYRDASAMKSDLSNYLNHYPVSAAGNSRGYRFRSFARRNRAMLAVSCLATTLVIASSVAYLVVVGQARAEAERERQLAEESLNFLLGFFDDVAPEQAQDHEITARELIDKGVIKVREGLGEKPDVQAKLMLAMSTLYTDFGDHEQAQQLAQDARAYYLTNFGEDYPESRQASGSLARALYLKGDFAASADLYTEILGNDERLEGPVHEKTLASRANLASVYWYMGRREEATAEFKVLYENTARALGERHEETVRSGLNYALGLQSVGEIERSLPILETQLVIGRDALGESHPLTLAVQNALATGLVRNEETERAQILLEELVELSNRVHGEDHPESLNTANNLAAIYYRAGEIQKAVDVQSDVIERMAKVQGADHPRVLGARSQLAYGLAQLNETDRASALINTVIEQQEQMLGSAHLDTLNSQMYKAGIMVLAEDPQVRQFLTDLIAVLEAELGVDHYRTVNAREQLDELSNNVNTEQQ